MVGVINELRQRAEEQVKLKEELAARLDGTMKVLTGVRAGLEHVAEKLEASLVVTVLLDDDGKCKPDTLIIIPYLLIFLLCTLVQFAMNHVWVKKKGERERKKLRKKVWMVKLKVEEDKMLRFQLEE